MNIKINVYNDCTSDKPSKTYEVKRILFKTAMNLAALQEEAKTAADDKQTDLTLKMLQTIIPEFTAEDMSGIDLVEFNEFFDAINSEVGKVVARAQKN